MKLIKDALNGVVSHQGNETESLDDIFRRILGDEEFERLDAMKGNYLAQRNELIRLDDSRKYTPKGVDCPICLNKGGKYKILRGEELSAYNKKQGMHEGYMNECGLPVWELCQCSQVNTAIQLNKETNLGNLTTHRLNDFIVTEEFQQKIKELAVRFLMEDNKSSWFLLSGQSGCGKTHVCSAIANELVKRNRVVRYIIYPDFIGKMKAATLNLRESIIDEYANYEVLYIDDLFKGSNTNTDKEIAFKLINARYNRNKVTIISTEMTEQEMDELDEAISGRLSQKSKGFYLEIGKKEGRNYRKR